MELYARSKMGAGTIRAAAIQLDARLGDVDYNVAACERLVEEAAARGAKWIALPEFFTTGMAFDRSARGGCTAP